MIVRPRNRMVEAMRHNHKMHERVDGGKTKIDRENEYSQQKLDEYFNDLNEDDIDGED